MQPRPSHVWLRSQRGLTRRWRGCIDVPGIPCLFADPGCHAAVDERVEHAQVRERRMIQHGVVLPLHVVREGQIHDVYAGHGRQLRLLNKRFIVITRGLPRPCPRAPTARAARLWVGSRGSEKRAGITLEIPPAGRSFFIFAGRFGAAGSAARFGMPATHGGEK